MNKKNPVNIETPGRMHKQISPAKMSLALLAFFDSSVKPSVYGSSQKDQRKYQKLELHECMR